MSNTTSYTTDPTATAFQQSAVESNVPTSANFTSGPAKPVAHHVHREDEPLPGSRGAAPTVDYTPSFIAQAVLPPSEVGDTQDFHRLGGPHHDHAHANQNHCTHHPSCEKDKFCVDRVPDPDHSVKPFEETTPAVPTKQTPLPALPGYVGTTENREYNASNLQDPRRNYDIDGKPVGGEELTYSKPSFGDKVVGKTEQLAGKITGNSDLQDKGHNRSHGLS